MPTSTRQRQREELEDRQAFGRTHQKREQASDTLEKNHEGRECRGQERTGQNLAKNVTAEDLHRAAAVWGSETGEGTMGSLGSSSSTFVTSRSSISTDGATTVTGASLEPKPSSAKGAPLSM
jgi:hypothetical protein